MSNIWYSAWFVTDPEKLKKDFPPKHAKVFAHHSTIAFKPESEAGLELGKRVSIKVLGRAFDDKGDALFVENPKSKMKFPHITLSCSPETDPVYSNELLERASANGSIEYFKEPYYIDAIEGYETLDLNPFKRGMVQ
jgi:hypothetical protein